MWGDGVGEQIRAAVPDADVVTVGPPSDFDRSVRGEVLFAIWFDHPLFEDLDAHGVEWMHLPGTGIDAIPRHLLEGRTVTCSRGVERDPHLRVRRRRDARLREELPVRVARRGT